MSTTIHSFGLTDIGSRRPTNQDQFLIADVHEPVAVVDASDDLGVSANRAVATLLAVADGMGGQPEGGRASRIAVQCLHEYVDIHWRDFLITIKNADHDVSNHLESAFHHAHQTMHAMSREDPVLRGMGTTLTAAFIFWPRLFIAHAGDSRCYLHRGSRLRQITTDQTMAAFIAQNGDEQDEPPPSRLDHVLYNCLGGDADDLEVERQRLELEPSDTLVLCTDGLTNHVDDRQIQAIVNSAPSADDACRQLIDAAKQAGGTDNITAIVACCHPAEHDACGEQTNHAAAGDDATTLPLSPPIDPLADTLPYVPADQCGPSHTGA